MLFCHALVTYMYGDDPTERTTRVTFAVQQTEDQTHEYTAAWTAPMDNFTKVRGRQLAEARLLRRGDRYKRTFTTAAEDYHTIFETVMADAMDQGPCRWTILDISFFKTPSTDDSVTV